MIRGIREGTRTVSRRAAHASVLVLSLALPALATTASAQRLAPKPLLEGDAVAQPCAPLPPPSLISATVSATVDSLLEAGTRAAILGDNYHAGELLREAAALDPGNPLIAYRLGRIYEERGESDLAVGEYCRYLQVAPQGADAAEVDERMRRLSATAAERDREEFEAAASSGFRALEQRRYQAAAAAFTRALAMRVGWAAGYFNRALALAALRDDSAAVADLQTYLQLQPAAADRLAVERQIERLRQGDAWRPRGLPSPGGVFAGGLLLPGLGQFVTRRPLGGLVVLAGAVGAAYWGIRQETVVRTETAVDPFGNPYDFQVRSLERPNLAIGLGVAAAVALMGAVEASLYARRQREPPPDAGGPRATAAARPRLRLIPNHNQTGLELGLQVPLPQARP